MVFIHPLPATSTASTSSTAAILCTLCLSLKFTSFATSLAFCLTAQTAIPIQKFDDIFHALLDTSLIHIYPHESKCDVEEDLEGDCDPEEDGAAYIVENPH